MLSGLHSDESDAARHLARKVAGTAAFVQCSRKKLLFRCAGSRLFGPRNRLVSCSEKGCDTNLANGRVIDARDESVELVAHRLGGYTGGGRLEVLLGGESAAKRKAKTGSQRNMSTPLRDALPEVILTMWEAPRVRDALIWAPLLGVERVAFEDMVNDEGCESEGMVVEQEEEGVET